MGRTEGQVGAMMTPPTGVAEIDLSKWGKWALKNIQYLR